MEYLPDWPSADDVKKFLGTDEDEWVIDAIFNKDLPVYDKRTKERIEPKDFLDWYEKKVTRKILTNALTKTYKKHTYRPKKSLKRFCFRKEDIEALKKDDGKDTNDKISANMLSKSELFNKVAPVIFELGVYCHEYFEREGLPPRKKDAFKDVLDNYRHFMPEYLQKAVWRARPEKYVRKLGDTNENLKSRKK